MRYGIPYGRAQERRGDTYSHVRKALSGVITIAGDGSQFEKFIYVEDLAERNATRITVNRKNKIYNLDGKGELQ